MAFLAQRSFREGILPATSAQKADGHVLLCSCVAESDLEIEVREAGGVEDIPLQRVATRVDRLERIQDDTQHLRTPAPRPCAFSPASTFDTCNGPSRPVRRF